LNYQWDFSGLIPFIPAFGKALLVTIELALLASLIGTLAGVPLALGLRATKWISVPIWFFTDTIRAIPNLVLIFFFYYFPFRELFSIKPISGFGAVLLALALAQAAYSADLIRAAIDQVPRSQVMGVMGLGFTPRQVVANVMVPSVVKQTLPGHIALWIGNIKLSSLASVIGVADVVFLAKIAMSQTFRSLESWTVVALTYVVVVLPCTFGLRLLERSHWIQRQ
jgi:His/Glu/Gln/Arg/opine family amino acid ABC transporter permease subunit